MKPFSFERREPWPNDVQIDIFYSGVCHWDIHTRAQRMGGGRTVYPCVPGHEIAGWVVKVGGAVKKFKEGEMVAGGLPGRIGGHASPPRKTAPSPLCSSRIPRMTVKIIQRRDAYGGYSNYIVVDQNIVLHLPNELNPVVAAPLLCAEIRACSPRRRYSISARGAASLAT